MNSEALRLLRAQLHEAVHAHAELVKQTRIHQDLVELSKICSMALDQGGTIFFAGNGGSFADAQHLAAELTGKMSRMRGPLASVALGTNGSAISAIGNDFSYSETFARELEGLARPNSVVIAMSTSGNSDNIVCLVHRAKKIGLPVWVFTGAGGGKVVNLCPTIQVPSDRTERIQEMHILLGHSLCLLIEEYLGVCRQAGEVAT